MFRKDGPTQLTEGLAEAHTLSVDSSDGFDVGARITLMIKLVWWQRILKYLRLWSRPSYEILAIDSTTITISDRK